MHFIINNVCFIDLFKINISQGLIAVFVSGLPYPFQLAGPAGKNVHHCTWELHSRLQFEVMFVAGIFVAVGVLLQAATADGVPDRNGKVIACLFKCDATYNILLPKLAI
jgi:hypothetical protein